MLDRDLQRKTQDRLEQLVAVLEPIARAVKCLESSHSTPADVYLFWLAILATLEELFEKNDDPVVGVRLLQSVINDIRNIVNMRWRESTEDGNKGNANGGAVYVSALFLNARKLSLVHSSTIYTQS